MDEDFSDKLNRFIDDCGSRPDTRDCLDEVVEAIGYDSLDYFFEDNPGAIGKVLEWIEEFGEKCPEWEENLDDRLSEMDEDDYDDSMDGDHASGLTLAGFGTDEDYGGDVEHL